MIHRVLLIGRWVIDLLIAPTEYDKEGVLACLYEIGVPPPALRRALSIMDGGRLNRAFTYGNSGISRALVVIGPASSGKRLLQTISRQICILSELITTT